MRTFTRVSIVIAGSAALVGSMALPASAVEAPVLASDSNTATVTIEGQPLTLDTTSATFTLSHSGSVVGASTAEGTLEGITVVDANSDGAGWTSTATLTDLALVGDVDTSISAAEADYSSLVTSGAQTGVTVTSTDNILTATTAANNSVTWNTTVTIPVPNTVVSGDYTGTLLHSVS